MSIVAEKTGVFRATELDLEEIVEKVYEINEYEVAEFDPGLKMTALELRNVVSLLSLIFTEDHFGAVFIFRLKGRIKGMVVGYMNGDRGMIQDIWVHKKFRGGSIFFQLYKSIYGYLKAGGAKCLCASTAVKNERVLKLMSKLGFRPVSVSFQKDMENEQ